MKLQLKIATGAAVFMLATSAVQAQTSIGPFETLKRSENPLRGPLNVNYEPAPAPVDLDGDGDYDLVLGELSGELRYFINRGTKTSALFDELIGIQNPFNGINAFSPAPALADMDDDNDFDLIIGQADGTIRYFENAGTAQAPAFAERIGTDNPFNLIDPGDMSSPVLLDFDDDGDIDLFVGTDAAAFYYQNNGNSAFSLSSFHGISLEGTAVAPAAADTDTDNDDVVDIIVAGDYTGGLRFFSADGGNFVELVGNQNPFHNFYGADYTSPAFCDFDNDGDMDLLVGGGRMPYASGFFYFENKGNGSFEEKHGQESPVGGIDVGNNATPMLFDFDGDGDMDALIGNNDLDDANIRYYRNDNGKFNDRTATSPFANLSVVGYFTPELVDLDNDKDLDLVSGSYEGQIVYFRNDAGVYYQIATGAGPFNGIDTSSPKTLVDMADIDGDGDLDLFAGNHDGSVHFYRNTGTASVPAFTEVSNTENPLSSIDYDGPALIHFADVDHDEDYDLVIGSFHIEVASPQWVMDYYENTGSSTSPVFTLGSHQFLFNFALAEAQAHFHDFDGDGDLDMLVGTAGQVTLALNRNPGPVVQMSTTQIQMTMTPGASIVIDNQLVINDPDSDELVEARIIIEGYQPGNAVLTFTAQGNITGNFDATTGILTLKGKATIGEYQAVLRTVAASYPASGGGVSATAKNLDYERTISIQVFDIDYTNTTPASRSITFVETVETPPLGEVMVYNAVAPHSSGDNKWMRILNLPPGNKVTIMNRWGDKVCEITEYNNDIPGKRFEGLNHHGKELASGTYYYKIEADNLKTITGYLTLKR